MLYLGSRTPPVAHMVIHFLRHILAPDCFPLFTSDGLHLYFYAARDPFWTLTPGASARKERAPAAGGGGSDLWPSEKMLPAVQAGSGHTHGASRDRGRSQHLLVGDGLLGTAEYCFYRMGESEGPPRHLSAGTSHLGHSAAVSSTLVSHGMVARLLSFCASPRSITSGARAAARTRWQASGATLSATNSGDGSRENYPTMDGAQSALLPLATDFLLSATQARDGCSVISRGDG